MLLELCARLPYFFCFQILTLARSGWIGQLIGPSCHTEIIGGPIAGSSYPNLVNMGPVGTISSKPKVRTVCYQDFSSAQRNGRMMFGSTSCVFEFCAATSRSQYGSQIGAAILDIAYGIKALPENDPLIEMVEDTISMTLQALVPGRFLVDTIPWLKYVPAWVPGASFQNIARESKAKVRTMCSIPFQQVKRAMVRDLQISLP